MCYVCSNNTQYKIDYNHLYICSAKCLSYTKSKIFTQFTPTLWNAINPYGVRGFLGCLHVNCLTVNILLDLSPGKVHIYKKKKNH